VGMSMLCPGQVFPSVSLGGAEQHFNGFVAGAVKTGVWKLYLFLETRLRPIGAVEIAYLTQLHEEFALRNIKGVGVVSETAFFDYYKQECAQGNVKMPLEILNDSNGELGRAVGVSMPQRASFLVDPKGVVRYACSYDAAYPRNVFSILAVFDSLHTAPMHDAMRGLKPANSKPC
jgi:alkyl hydroperoxide reductase subunit AhpC